MYFSIFDSETGCHLHTGLNSKNRKDAINDGVDYILSDGGTEAPSRVKRMNLKDKEGYLAGHNLTIEEHTKRLPDEDDDEPIDYRANNRSPFGIGS